MNSNIFVESDGTFSRRNFLRSFIVRSRSMAMRTGAGTSGKRSRTMVDLDEVFKVFAASVSKLTSSIAALLADEFVVVGVDETTFGAGEPSI